MTGPAGSGPPTRAAMWEARAVDGGGAELLAWVYAEGLPALRGTAGLERVEVLTGPGDRVLLIAWWAGEPAAGPGEPPPALLARPVHSWAFTRVHSES